MDEDCQETLWKTLRWAKDYQVPFNGMLGLVSGSFRVNIYKLQKTDSNQMILFHKMQKKKLVYRGNWYIGENNWYIGENKISNMTF